MPVADPSAGYSSVFSISAIFSRGKRGSHSSRCAMPCLHLRLSRLGPVVIKPATLIEIRRPRRQAKLAPDAATMSMIRRLRVLSDFQVLAVVGHRDVAEHLEIQRGLPKPTKRMRADAESTFGCA